MTRTLILPVIIALNYMAQNSINNDGVQTHKQKIVFNISLRNETFITNELIKFSNSSLTAQLNCIYDSKLYCFLTKPRSFLNLYKVDFLPTTYDYIAEYDDSLHELNNRIFVIEFNALGVYNLITPTSPPLRNESLYQLKYIVNQFDFQDDVFFPFGSCPFKLNVKYFIACDNSLNLRATDLDVDVEKIRDMENCNNKHNWKYIHHNITNFEYSRSKIIAKSSKFFSSTESFENSEQYFPDLQDMTTIKSRLNISLTFLKTVDATLDDLMQMRKYFRA